ncbi:TcaA NTF2-like domain-containing protein [Paenibacillus sp. EC2-1]|uniref:TcaA NTF2-like domain-containing protein n=1 Tax=Paenibacillus sp. EC2-1 TaxID=3388665 RepID=UPI003BEF0AEB
MKTEAANHVKEMSSEPLQAAAVATASNTLKPSSTSRTGKMRIRLILAASLLLVAALLVGGYQLGNYWTSEERLISRFENAVQSQDYKAVASMFASDEETLVINEQTVKSYVDYLKKNNELVDDIVKDLRRQAFTLKSVSEAKNDIDYEVLLQQNGKIAFIFEEYKLHIEPIHIYVTTNYKDTIIKINGEEAAVANKADFDQTFGPYFPGVFELETALHTEWIDLEQKETATVMSGGQDYTAYMELSGTEVEIDTGYYDGTGLKGELHVNGKATGINPFETPSFGPVPTDGTVKFMIDLELPWGTMRTEEVPVESSFVRINIGDIQDAAFEDKLIEQIVQFNRDELKAVTSGDLMSLESVTDNMMSYEQTIVDQIEQSREAERSTYLGSTFDRDSFIVFKEEGQWRLSALAIGSYLYEYKEGEVWKEGSEESQGRYYTLIYDENKKQWLMDAVSIFYDGEEFSDNLKEVREQHTVAYEAKVQSAANRVDLESLQLVMHNYLSLSVQAINNRDFSLVSGLIDPDGPAYEESKKYIPYLEKKGITEELLNVQAVSFRVLDDTSIEVTTNDTYNIIDKDGNRKERSYTSTYKLIEQNGDWKIHTLMKTVEK